MFYDLDAAESPSKKLSESDREMIVNAYENPELIAQEVISKTRHFFEGDNFGLSCKFMVLSAHGWSKEKKMNKMSYHIIVKLQGKNGEDVFVKDMEAAKAIAKNLFPELVRVGIVDEKVYKGERVFRTIGSSKPGENRPLVKCQKLSSPGTTDMDSFLCYGPAESSDSTILSLSDLRLNPCTSVVPGPKTKKCKMNHTSSSLIPSNESEVISLLDHLDEKYYTDRNYWLQICHILECIGTSLEVWLTFSSKWDSYDKKSATAAWESIKRKHETDNPGHTIADLRKLIQRNESDALKIERGEKECVNLVLQVWDDNVTKFDYDSVSKQFSGKAGLDMNKHFSRSSCESGCKIFHIVNEKGFLMECHLCHNRFPMMPMLIPRTEAYTNILNVTVNQTIINNYGSSSSRAPAVINLDKNVFNDESVTYSMNRILSGHTLVASEFLKENVSGFVYSKDKKALFYHFTGVIWEEDVDNMHLRARLRSLDQFFTQIISFYSELPITEVNKSILDVANKQIVKFSDIHHLNKIIEGSQDFYYIPKFTERLDSNGRLLAFDNGVYDLANNVFRQATMEDYLSITVGYDYDPEVETEFLWEFLRQILPQPHLLDYLLKRLADCLDGTIPNTIFLIISGNGANGKSQIFNLMEKAMGLGYGRKIANTLLTRKRENANDTNSEMIDMKGKRFIFFSEPESGEKFNISCLKDLTGSETVKATAKYEGSSSFTINAKMFIGCNVVPAITEDNAIWRRVRSLEFKSNFVDEPNPDIPNQYLREPAIPDKIRQDVNWRKALMKILITYYYIDIAEPDDVRRHTEALREENNDMEAWCHENIERDPDFEVKQQVSPKAHSHWLVKEEVKRALSLKSIKEVDKVIVPFLQRNMPGIDPLYKKQNFNTPSGERKNGFNCWLGVKLRRPEFKTEAKLYEWLKSKFSVEREKSFPWTLNTDTNHFRRYDFFLQDFNILIELDGIQHFEQVPGWENVREIKRIDKEKNELALNNNFHIIRICQRIVWRNIEDWERKLLTAITDLKEREESSMVLIGSIYLN